MKTFVTACAIISATYAASASQITSGTLNYANIISAHNITNIQNSISSIVFDANDYYGMHIGRITTNTPAQPKISSDDMKKMYGRAPMYGTMPLYGEWNDDGSATRGHSGGDTLYAPQLNTWAAWRHTKQDDKFDNLKEIHTKNDIIMLGLGSNGAKIGIGTLYTGIFGGYTGGDQKNTFIDLTESGGYLGIYTAYNIHQLHLAGIATVGKIENKMPHKFGGSNFNNVWASLNANATYDILIDPTFTIQPGLRLGYTWIKSDDYISFQHTKITNDNFNIFEFTPAVRAIKNISNGWFGMAHARYIFKFTSGGDVSVAGTEIPDLKIGDYAEYGLGLEKAFGPLNTSIEINRRDGAIRGWTGGARLKIVF